MITNGQFLIFLAAAMLLAISTGPGMLYVLARSLKVGRKTGFALRSEPLWSVWGLRRSKLRHTSATVHGGSTLSCNLSI